MEEIKLTEIELQSIKYRDELLFRYKLTVDLLITERNTFVSSLLEKYKLDNSKNWLISNEGIVSEKS